VFQETLYRCNCRFEDLDEVILGNVVMPADAANPARVAALWAQIPQRIPPDGAAQLRLGDGVDRRGIHANRRGPEDGAGRGAESMSNVPLLFPHETMEPMSRLAKARTTTARSRRWRGFGAAFQARRRTGIGLTDAPAA